MPIPFRTLPLVLTLALGTAGCAAPIKTLMQAPPNQGADDAVLATGLTEATKLAEAQKPAPEADRSALKIALEKKAAAMRAEMIRKPAAPGGSPLPQKLPNERLPTGLLANERAQKPQPQAFAREEPRPADRVKEMLAKVRQTNGATKAAPLEPSPLSTRFQVKSEVKLASLGASMPMPDAPTIHFADKSSVLDTAGNRVLASLIGKAENPLEYRLIVTGGLAGPGQPWEKMQLASARIETLTNHVPPPMVVERRFDPGLDLADVRLELVKGRR